VIAIVDVFISIDTARSVAEFAQASLGKSFVPLATNQGSLDIQFLGFQSEFMIVGETKEGLGVVILLDEKAKRDKRHATIILSTRIHP